MLEFLSTTAISECRESGLFSCLLGNIGLTPDQEPQQPQRRKSVQVDRKLELSFEPNRHTLSG